jgi:hypothetical protein
MIRLKSSHTPTAAKRWMTPNSSSATLFDIILLNTHKGVDTDYTVSHTAVYSKDQQDV